ncbi:MAG: SPOR domain-containing protein [Thermodesulfobacteriota bacterium]
MSELKPKLVLAKSKRGGGFKLILLLLFTFGIGVFVGTKIGTVNIVERDAFTSKEAKVSNSGIDTKGKGESDLGKSNLPVSTLAPNPVKNGKEIEESTPLSESLTDKIYEYTIQVAAFEGMEKAQRVVNELKEKDYDAYIVSVSNSRGEAWNLIKVGKFETREEAQTAANLLQQKEASEAVIEELKLE